MSIQAVSWALEQDIRKPIEKLILVSLANHANHITGECYPKVETIAHEASCTARSVQRHLPNLEERGLVRIEERFEAGRQLSNRYWLLMGNGRSGGGDSLSPCGGKVLPPVTPGGDTAGAPINHPLNQDFPPKSSRAPSVDKLKSGHPSEETPRSSSAAPPHAPAKHNRPWKDRGRYEAVIIQRLGEEGPDILATLPDWRIGALCKLQRDDKLNEATLEALRIEYQTGRQPR